MAKAIPDYGKSKLLDYHREDHGEPRFEVKPDAVAPASGMARTARAGRVGFKPPKVPKP